jgi:DNA repair protein RecO (recombination protein O)
MIVKTEGLVLKQVNFSENSLILKIFTREYGLLSFLIKGAKSGKNKSYGILRPMSFLNLVFYLKENKNLCSLKEYQLVFAPDSKNFGMYKTAIAFFMTEVVQYSLTEENEKDISKYDFIRNSFDVLAQSNDISSGFYLSFFAQYAYFLGIDINTDVFQNEEIRNFIDLLKSNENYSLKLNLSLLDRKNIFKEILGYYQYHLPHFKAIHSIEILEKVFA